MSVRFHFPRQALGWFAVRFSPPSPSRHLTARGLQLAGAAAMAVCFPAVAALSANGDCGVPLTDGGEPKASDCLFILRVAVGIGDCVPCICDTSPPPGVTASDALLCLRVAVGQSASLACPPCPETTTTMMVTTTTESAPTTTLPVTTTTQAPTTTTTLPVTTTTESPTTTVPATTTTEAPTTTLAPSGACPVAAEWTTHAAWGEPCTSNSDCEAGPCDAVQGRCRSQTDFDLGWTGLGHDGDLLAGTTLRVHLDCAAGQAPCGQCAIAGIDPSTGSCRCANDFRARCDAAFELDTDDCPACFAGAFVGNACANNADCVAGTCERRCANNLAVLCDGNSDCPGSTCGAQAKCSNGKNCTLDSDCSGTCTTSSKCQCYEAPPLALSIGGTPFCYIQRIDAEPAGSVDVDGGASSVAKQLAILMYGGETVAMPCPVCGGRCSNEPATACIFDGDCEAGAICQLDEVVADGIRDGVCIGGRSDGLACDVEAVHTSLPPGPAAARGAGASLDCAPNQGLLLSGSGLALSFVESTGQSELEAALSCGGTSPQLQCPCLICSASASTPCSSNADCAPDKGSCSSGGAGGSSFPLPNACDQALCAGSGDDATCAIGPDDSYCDGLLRASGRGFVPCSNNADCDSLEAGAGDCTLVERRACFADPIVAAGSAHPRHPLAAGAFCLAATSTAGRNAVIGLPGPARILRHSALQSFCAGNSGLAYEPGSGGCPP